MHNPDPSPEDTFQMVVEAYKRVYQTDCGRYFNVYEMWEALKDELHLNTNCHIRFQDDPQPASEETFITLPECIHMVVMHNVGICFTESYKVTEEWLKDLCRKIEQAGIPIGLVLTMDTPTPKGVRVDAVIQPWERQVMEAISWDEE